MQEIGIGLLGSGFMGATHARGFRLVASVLDLAAAPRLELLADTSTESARAAAARLGFARSTPDWREVVSDPMVQLVDVATPNHLHAPMALAAIDAGRHVYCEKPLAPDADTARRMVDAAERAGVVNAVGFNYLCNPMIALARDMIQAGELGRVWSFRGSFDEAFMRDPENPWSWRLDPAAGPGVLADLGSHAISLARFLLGPIDEVMADLQTVIADRPDPVSGARRKVATDDQARLLLRFASGTRGSIEASWLATGRTNRLAFEITGERGALVFDQERLNELRLFRVEPDPARNGFRTIQAGPEHPPYGAFCPAPGHQLGYNELKVIEIGRVLAAVSGGPPPLVDFREAWQVQRVIDAALASSRQRCWIPIP